MRPDRNPESIEVVSKSIVLAGPPADLRGEIVVRNAAPEKAVAKRVSARLRASKKVAAGQPTEVTTLAPIVMRPEEESVRFLSFDFGRLGPGEYEGEVQVGGRWYPARFQVAARDRVSVEPGRLVIESEPGATVTRTLLVRNLGNTRRECRSTPDIYLEEEEFSCATLRRTARALSREEPSLGRIVGEYFHQGDEALKAAGHIAVVHDAVVLEPGESGVVELRLKLPRPRPAQETSGRFVGVLRFFDSRIDIALRLYGTRGEGESEATASRRRASS